MSATEPAAVWVIFVSVPLGTAVETLNAGGVARPEPPALSLAAQGTVTSEACHAATGGVQLKVGAVLSTLIVNVGLALFTVLALLSLVMRLSTVPALSVAENVTTVVP